MERFACGGGGGLTEIQLLFVENVLVEQNDAGAHGNPDTAQFISCQDAIVFERNSHDIEGRVYAALRRLRLFDSRVDGRQDGRRMVRSVDLGGASFLFHCVLKRADNAPDKSLQRTDEAKNAECKTDERENGTSFPPLIREGKLD
jgi:hypothetical protein